MYDGDDIIEISQSSIVAWRIEYSESNEDSSAIPITVNYSLPGTYAIYDSDTKLWEIPEDRSGDGLEELLEVFRSRK